MTQPITPVAEVNPFLSNSAPSENILLLWNNPKQTIPQNQIIPQNQTIPQNQITSQNQIIPQI